MSTVWVGTHTSYLWANQHGQYATWLYCCWDWEFFFLITTMTVIFLLSCSLMMHKYCVFPVG